MTTWLPLSDGKGGFTAPMDGTMILACGEGPWDKSWLIDRAPQTISYRTYHPNRPGKPQWRDKDGHPVYCTHWMVLMDGPTPQP